MNKIINGIIKRLIHGSYSTLIALFIIAVLLVVRIEVIDTLKWFFHYQLRVILSDKQITSGIAIFITSLLLYKKRK
jgi:hypothetical protein